MPDIDPLDELLGGLGITPAGKNTTPTRQRPSPDAHENAGGGTRQPAQLPATGADADITFDPDATPNGVSVTFHTCDQRLFDTDDITATAAAYANEKQHILGTTRITITAVADDTFTATYTQLTPPTNPAPGVTPLWGTGTILVPSTRPLVATWEVNTDTPTGVGASTEGARIPTIFEAADRQALTHNELNAAVERAVAELTVVFGTLERIDTVNEGARTRVTFVVTGPKPGAPDPGMCCGGDTLNIAGRLINYRTEPDHLPW